MNFDLAKWREQNGVSQQDLADRLGVRQSYVSYIERCGLPDNITMLRKISRETGVPLDELKPDEDVAASA